MRPCFVFKAQAADKPTVLAIDDEIGFWGTQAKDFRSSLNAVSGDLEVEINSPGGDAFAGIAMFNMLKAFADSGRQVTTRVTGIAASAASVVFLAGTKREMPKNTMTMIHGPSGGAYGSADELRDTADALDKVQSAMRGIYTSRMGISDAEADTLLAKDSWLTADEALAMGFATVVTDGVQATAKFDMARADLPEAVRAVFKAQAADPAPVDPAPADPAPVDPAPADPAPVEPLADQIAAAAAKAGFEAYSPLWAVVCTSMVDVVARINSAKEIKALCAVAKKADMADGFIKGNKALDEVRAELVKALAHHDSNTHTDGSQTVNSQATDQAEKPKVSTASLWASHRGQKSERT